MGSVHVAIVVAGFPRGCAVSEPVLERPYTREQILQRLRQTIAAGDAPSWGVGSSRASSRRSAEAGGADLIIVYSTGKTRLWGLPTTPLLTRTR